jgi:hypothetical protein
MTVITASVELAKTQQADAGFTTKQSGGGP